MQQFAPFNQKWYDAARDKYSSTYSSTSEATAEIYAQVCVTNNNLKVVAGLVDSEGTAKLIQQRAQESEAALSAANKALQASQVTVELTKDVQPLIAKLELIDQRLQAIEKKQAESTCACVIS